MKTQARAADALAGQHVQTSELAARGLAYTFIEVQYRDGQREIFPPDYRFSSDVADARVLWVLDAFGPLYRRMLGMVDSILLKEVAA